MSRTDDLTLGSLRISPDVLAMVPFEIMERLHVIPLDLKVLLRVSQLNHI